MNAAPAITVSALQHHYGDRCAIDNLEFEIARAEIFAFVGPNGGGKTTLFRILSTLMPMQRGKASVLGYDLATNVGPIRREIGVVFQSPSLDKKLTVEENLRHQGHLYGLSASHLRARREELLMQVGLADRRSDLVEKLSGGLRRRVELAKGMLHQPRLLLLDEPSTGLDPAARNDLWSYLRELQENQQVTVVLTTHLLEEAEKADRVAILNEGQLVANDTPDTLRATVGGDAITIQSKDSPKLAEDIRREFGFSVEVLEDEVRFEEPEGHRLIAKIVEAFPGCIEAITYARPSLEDVFIDRTGHRYRQDRIRETEKN
ncbi:MAG: ABC transporter ATP-binding protein [Planctomycetaceae bacterium TMED10]|nr:MAG: ABC transporter ATP-binding protein [Planctomycetaceae bacterium TMED10]